MIRIIDILLSIILITVTLPLLLVVSIILLFSPGRIFYTQVRVGKGGRDFTLFKFRTMTPNADSKGLLTVGGRDSRVTRIGYYLRKYKLDELPQLFNILKADMSFVGPRPEVRKYVELYTTEQRKVLSVKPGLTDMASITYLNENELLEMADDPEEYYIQEVMPKKILLNMGFINNPSLTNYWKIILKTFIKVSGN